MYAIRTKWPCGAWSGKWYLRFIVIVNMRLNLRTQSNICEYLLRCVLDLNKTAVRFLYVFDLNEMPVHIRFQTPIKTSRPDIRILQASLCTRSSLYKYLLLRVSTLSNLFLSRSSLYKRRICCLNSINHRASGAKGRGFLILRCESHPPLCVGLVWFGRSTF